MENSDKRVESVTSEEVFDTETNNINNNSNNNITYTTVVFLKSPSNESSSVGSYRRTMSNNDKLNSTSIYCRICHEDESLEELVDPCKCTGSLGVVHASCLEKWLSTSNTDRCEICKYPFTIQRKNKPITQWWRSSSVHGPRGMVGDTICLLILTPLCIAATYLCALGASAYSRLGYWEGTGLAVLCSLLVATYCLWLTITLRFHYKIWRQWRRQNQDVVLLVKHKADHNAQSNITKNFTTGSGNGQNLNAEKSPLQTRNNNNNNLSIYGRPTRLIFGVTFTHQEDPIYSMQQQTSFV